MGNTCKSAKSNSTIQTIAEPPISTATKHSSEEISTTTKVNQSANGTIIREEEVRKYSLKRFK
jgi:hypothetical protein